MKVINEADLEVLFEALHLFAQLGDQLGDEQVPREKRERARKLAQELLEMKANAEA